MQWLAAQFGAASLLETPMVLPTPEFFPEPFSGCEEDVRPMLVRVCQFLRTDPGRVDLSYFDGDQVQKTEDGAVLPSAAGFYVQGEGSQRPLIRISSKVLSDPLALVATLAHEVAHDRLLGEKRLTVNVPDHEPLTDLTTVFFGLGIFPANTAFRTAAWSEGMMQMFQWSSQGYLKDNVFGYAMALRAWLRGEAQVPWSSHLSINPRTACLEGLQFLNKTNDSACDRYSVLNGLNLPTEVSVNELRATSDTHRLSALMALWEHSSPTSEHLDAVVDCLESPNSDVQTEAINWLHAQDDLAPRAVHRLIELLRKGSDEVQLRAALLLASKRAGVNETTPKGLKLLDELVALAVQIPSKSLMMLADPLAAYGPAAQVALPRFVEALRPMLVQGSQADAEWLIKLLLRIAPDLDQRLKRQWPDTLYNLYCVAVKTLLRKPKHEGFAARKSHNKKPKSQR